MKNTLGDRPLKRTMTRRDFLWLSCLGTAGFITGCAVNPVTGKKQLLLMSESQEIGIDQQNSPHQFSADYGAVLDKDLNSYITQIGKSIAATSHRPQMPYSFRCVNATYINAYAFPGGSIAVTRGILVNLENEDELAALLGHEIGHVNARHTAERMTKNLFLNAAVALGSAYVSTQNETYGTLVAGLGGIGAGMLLAHYSRDDERQADALGLEYMSNAAYNPRGMVGLMDLLRSLSRHKPSSIEMMFSTHPMSDERYKTAKNASETKYGEFTKRSLKTKRYMDRTASLRKIKPVIEALQAGESQMMNQQYGKAERQFRDALKKAPHDYTALLLMTKCQLAQENAKEALQYAKKAVQVYPREAQGHHISGISHLMARQYGEAFQRFDEYEQMLPGNPNTIFLKGISQENMQHIEKAAQEYKRYLQAVQQGEQADHARQRLTEWGYLKPPVQQSSSESGS